MTYITTQQRNLDFIKACREVMAMLPGKAKISTKEIVERAIAMKAPNYYVGSTYAYKVIVTYRRTGRLPASPECRAMWIEIIYKVNNLRLRRRLSLMDAVTQVVEFSTASRFFITSAYALRLLQRLNAANRQKFRPNLIAYHDGRNPLRRSPRHCHRNYIE